MADLRNKYSDLLNKVPQQIMRLVIFAQQGSTTDHEVSNICSTYLLRGSVAEWLARRTRDLEVAGSIADQAML